MTTEDIQTAWKNLLEKHQQIYYLIKDKVKLSPQNLFADEDDWKGIFNELRLGSQDQPIVKLLREKRVQSVPPGTSSAYGAGWQRDLLRECVESNPGPSMTIVFDEIAARFSSSNTLVRSDLRKVEHEITNTVSPGRYGYTGEHVKSFFETLSLLGLASLLEISPEDARDIYNEARQYLGLELQQQVTQLQEELLALKSKLAEASKQVKYDEYDVWDMKSYKSMVRTEEDAIRFRRDMVENYKLGYAKCMVTGVYGKGRLTAVHIWPKGQTEISPLPENFEDNYRNGLILMRPIEHAFDRKQLCFLYNFFDHGIYLKLLDPALHEKTVWRRVKFLDLDGRRLMLPVGIFPFRRLLNLHSRAAYSHANRYGWITTTDFMEFKDFVDLSDKAEEDEDVPQSWIATGSEIVEEDDTEHDVPPEALPKETTVEATLLTSAQTAEEEEEDRVAGQLAEEAAWEDDKDWQICEKKKMKKVVVDEEVSFNIEVSDEDTNTEKDEVDKLMAQLGLHDNKNKKEKGNKKGGKGKKHKSKSKKRH